MPWASKVLAPVDSGFRVKTCFCIRLSDQSRLCTCSQHCNPHTMAILVHTRLSNNAFDFVHRLGQSSASSELSLQPHRQVHIHLHHGPTYAISRQALAFSAYSRKYMARAQGEDCFQLPRRGELPRFADPEQLGARLLDLRSRPCLSSMKD